MQKPKKAAVIGLDCALTHLIEKHIAEGHLPTFKKLFEQGVVAENCLTNFPTITPPGWATIATGAWAGTHQVTDFHVPPEEWSENAPNAVAAFSSERVQAEYIWDALDKAGKKSIVLNYPGSWPSHMKNGILVGGAGLSIGEHRDGHIALTSAQNLCAAQLITTGPYPNAIRGRFEEADGWTNVPDMGAEPLEMAATLMFNSALVMPEKTVWYVLARDTEGEGYDRVTLSPTKDFNDAFCTLSVGDWSPKIYTTIKFPDSRSQEAGFRCKLLELSDDADDFRLLISMLEARTGWSEPPEIAEQIVSREGTIGPGGGILGYAVDWYGLDTYVEVNEQHDQWLGDAAVHLLSNHDWDLFYMHSHPPDWAYHAIMTDMDPATCKSEDHYRAAWQAHLQIYQSQDRMLARLLEAMGDDTLVVLVSDHGATPDGPPFNPWNALVPAGLAVLQSQELDDEMLRATLKATEGAKVKFFDIKAIKEGYKMPEITKTKAFPHRSIHIYINLKGRTPFGIVDPKDYEMVQQEIIDALYTYVDPATGRRPVALALTKQDARILGLYGENIGDVIYAIYPEFGSQHGPILPTAKSGIGSLRGLLTMTGPGLKKNYRLERTCWLTDLVPTICYLMNWPVPEQSEGGVMYQAFEDPDFKRHEAESLKNQLAELEKKLA